MHFRKNNPRNKYYIEKVDDNKLELKITKVEKDKFTQGRLYYV